MRDIHLYWARHAESCSNYDKKKMRDYPPEDYNSNMNIGYAKKENPIISPDFNKSSLFVNYKLLPEEEEYMQDKEKTQSNILFSVARYHPNLSFIGMQHAILLGQYFKDKNITAIFVSPTLRAIMTALIAFRSHSPVTIHVVPYIHEKMKSKNIINPDYKNTPLQSDRLKRMVEFVKDWLEYKWFDYYDDIEINNTLLSLQKQLSELLDKYPELNLTIELINKMLNYKVTRKNNILLEIYNSLIQTSQPIPELSSYITFLENFINPEKKRKIARSQIVNFSIWELYERINNPSIYTEKANLDKFYSDVLPLAYKLNYIPDGNICIISHGHSMRHYFHNKYPSLQLGGNLINTVLSNIRPLYNTQVIDELLLVSEDFKVIQPQSINYTSYVPPKIRSEYQNFESLNVDICRTNSIKGVVNNLLWDANPIHNNIDKYNEEIKSLLRIK